MEGQGTKAEALTYPQLIAKAKDGGHWQTALQLWDSAQAEQVMTQPRNAPASAGISIPVGLHVCLAVFAKIACDMTML